MITWFDALLITVWAAVTALGMRRGLEGLVWALFAVLAVFASNFAPSPVGGALLALVLGFGAAWAARRVCWEVAPRGWHLALGGVGGAALGLAVTAALALALPVRVVGSRGEYPSSTLPPAIYDATFGSLIVRDVTGLFGGGEAVKRLLLPDQAR